MRHGARLTPEAFWAHESELMDRIRHGARSLPVHTVRTWHGPVMVGDWNWEDDQLVSAGIIHGHPADVGPRVEVITTRKDPTGLAATLSGARPHASAGSGRDVVERRRDAAAQPPSGTHLFDVAGTATRFDVWERDDLWWAAGHLDGHGVVIVSRTVAVDDVALEPVTDLDRFIEGRATYLRALRGEG